jgi:hypothetical protein
VKNTALSPRAIKAMFAMAALLLYGAIVNPTDGANGLPCLWSLMSGYGCPGCGLSRAGAFMLRGQFSKAVASNWLIIPTMGVIALHLYSLITEEIRNQRPVTR